MAIIHEILKEEIERLEELKELYNKKISELPKGSIQEKDRNGKLYAYRAYRKGKKVKFNYIGKVSSDEVKKMKEQIKNRKEYEKKIKKVKADIKEIKKSLK